MSRQICRSDVHCRECNIQALPAVGLRDYLDAERANLSRQYRDYLEALEWSVNQTGEYGVGEMPLGDSRLQIISGLLERLRDRLGERVSAVRVTGRLTDSAACLALGEFDMGEQMRRLLEASGQAVPDSKPALEINADHPLVGRLAAESDDSRFGDLADLLLDQARLADGRTLEDPGAFVQRLNRLLLDMAGEAGESA